MSEIEFIDCNECGCIHYAIDKKKAKSLEKDGVDGFLPRNLTCCYKCGSKKRFSVISDMHVGYFGIDDKIPPLLIDHDKIYRAKGWE